MTRILLWPDRQPTLNEVSAELSRFSRIRAVLQHQVRQFALVVRAPKVKFSGTLHVEQMNITVPFRAFIPDR
jgi:hypothetical protein